MNSSRRNMVLRYALAMASVAVATWLRWVLGPALGDGFPFITYFAAIAVTAYFGGLGPTVVAIVLSAGLANFLFIAPIYRLMPQGTTAWGPLGLFCFVGMVMAILSELLHRAKREALASHEDASREQQRFHTTLASIGEGVIVTDAEGRVTFLNSVAEELTGCDLASAKGLSVERVVRLLDEATREPVENPVTQVLRDQATIHWPPHFVLLARDGRERSVEQSAAPLRTPQGQLTGVVLVFRDVSLTRRWDLERGRLAALLASSDDAIIGLTIRGAVVTWNSGAEQLYGYTAEEAIGQRIAALIIPSELIAEFNDTLGRVARGERVEPLETVRTNKSGRRLDVSKRVSSILDAEDQIVGISTIDRDISPQRAAERRRNARLAVTQILTQERSLEVAAARILEAVCHGLHWQAGGFWTLDETGTELHCRQFWQNPQLPSGAFREQTLSMAVSKGVGLPGRVWQETDCVWMADIARETNFVRAAAAAEAGFRSAFACRIIAGGSFLGVIEFFHENLQEPDDDVLEMMGTVGHQIGQFWDRQRGEAALRRNEEELRSRVKELVDAEERIRGIIDTAMDAIITFDERGVMQTFNTAAEDLFGYVARDVIGRNVRILMPESYYQQHEALITRYLQTGDEKIIGVGREIQGLRSDGATVPIEVAISEFHIKGKRYFTATMHDITERKRTESMLRFLADASTLLSELVDYRATLERVARLAVPDFADWCAVDMLTAEGDLERLAVAHADPEKQAQIEEFFCRHPLQADAPFGAPRVVRNKKSEWMADVTAAALAGSGGDEESLAFFRSIHVRSYLCVPLLSQNEMLGTLTFVLSDSGRRYGQRDLAVAEDVARRAVTAVENARLYQQVREADRRKDEFLAMLAHELRNPLAPIRSGLDILSLQSTAPSETLEVMQRQVDHLVRLVDDLLDVSRIMRGKVELRKQPVPLATIVKQALDAVKPATSDDKTISVTLPPEPVWLDVDRVRIVQVLENLLHNALKYTNHGARIELHALAENGEVVIHVCDDGIGIDAELLPTVFDLFTQSARSIDRAQGGLGIGLTLVRNLVQLHGGAISAHSEGPGQGSEFVVRLPVTSVAPQTDPAAPVVRPASGPRRVLVVDDNVGAARLLATLLRKLGPHEVEIAHDGPAALAKVPEFLPDLVLLDIGLPGMDGFETARAIRALEAGRHVRLVAVTGYGQEDDRRRSLEAGFDQHLVKPVAVSTLAELLAREGQATR